MCLDYTYVPVFYHYFGGHFSIIDTIILVSFIINTFTFSINDKGENC